MRKILKLWGRANFSMKILFLSKPNEISLIILDSIAQGHRGW